MKYNGVFVNVADVREYLRRYPLSGKSLYWSIPRPFRVVCDEFPDGVVVTSARKKSVEGRPRLFTKENQPIELSHCQENLLCQEFTSLVKFIHEENVNKEVTELVRTLTPHLNKGYSSELKDMGYPSDMYFSYGVKESLSEVLDKLYTDDLYKYSVDELKKISSAIEYFLNLKSKESFYKEVLVEGVNNLSAKEKSLFYDLKAKKLNDKIARELSEAWETSARFNVEDVVLGYDLGSWHVFDVTLAMKGTDKEVIFASNSSGCMEALYNLIAHGAKIVGPQLLIEKSGFGKDYETHALRINIEDLHE